MDYSTIIISMLVLGAFLVPPLYLSYRRNRKKKKMLTLINQLAESEKCKITAYDQWKDSCIGLDSIHHKLFFVQAKSGKTYSNATNLKEVQKCKISGINSSGNGKNENTATSERINLCLVFKDSGKADSCINFFDTETDYMVDDDDIKLSEKWNRLIQTELTNLSN